MVIVPVPTQQVKQFTLADKFVVPTPQVPVTVVGAIEQLPNTPKLHVPAVHCNMTVESPLQALIEPVHCGRPVEVKNTDVLLRQPHVPPKPEKCAVSDNGIGDAQHVVGIDPPPDDDEDPALLAELDDEEEPPDVLELDELAELDEDDEDDEVYLPIALKIPPTAASPATGSMKTPPTAASPVTGSMTSPPTAASPVNVSTTE